MSDKDENVMTQKELFGIDSSDVIYFSSPVTFDPNVVELFLALTSGATLFIISSNLKAASLEILNILFPSKDAQFPICVTFVQTTPSIFLSWPEKFIRERVMNDDTNLKVLALGGECCPGWDVLNKYRSKSNKTNLFYLYGITEVSCWASAHRVGPKDNGSNLGVPLKETIIQVRNDAGVDISEGIGEMFIGSNSRYCLIGNETCDEILLPVFRSTGDIVKVLNNEFTYVGRKNRVVKRWGHRVCLPEIEKVTLQHNGVRYCSCYKDDFYGIVLFVVFSQVDKDCKYVSEIRLSLKINLNEASVPDFIYSIDDIPRTCHGKVNYMLLKSVMRSKIEKLSKSSKQSIGISKEDLKLKIYTLWLKYTYHDVTKVESKEMSRFNAISKISDEFGFLKSGGNSISAVQFVSEMSEFLHVPDNLIGQLLRDCNFIECFEIINSTNCDALNKFENKNIGSNVDKALDSLGVRQCKRSVGVLDSCTNNDASNKKRNAKETGNLLYSKCRGKIFIYVSEENASIINPNGITLQVKWKYNLKKCVDASPTVVTYLRDKKLVLAGSHSGDVGAINLTDGKLVSLCHLPNRIESSALVSECGNQYYIGCYDKTICCINIHSGEILWRFVTLDMVKSTPVTGVHSTLIIGSYDHNIYCICTKSAKEIWRYKGTAAFSCVPFVTEDGKVVAASLDGMCIVLSADVGALLWNFKLSSPVFSSPTFFKDKIIFAEVAGTLHCFDLSTSELKWKFTANGNIFSSLVMCQSNSDTFVIFGCNDCFVYCLSVESKPILVWKTSFDSPVVATPFVQNDILAVCTTKGVVNVLRVDDGSIITSLPLSGEIFSSPVIEGNNVIVGCRDNHLYCLEMVNCTIIKEGQKLFKRTNKHLL